MKKKVAIKIKKSANDKTKTSFLDYFKYKKIGLPKEKYHILVILIILFNMFSYDQSNYLLKFVTISSSGFIILSMLINYMLESIIKNDSIIRRYLSALIVLMTEITFLLKYYDYSVIARIGWIAIIILIWYIFISFYVFKNSFKQFVVSAVSVALSWYIVLSAIIGAIFGFIIGLYKMKWTDETGSIVGLISICISCIIIPILVYKQKLPFTEVEEKPAEESKAIWI